MAAIEAQFMLSVGLIGKCDFFFRSFPFFMFMVVKANPAPRAQWVSHDSIVTMSS